MAHTDIPWKVKRGNGARRSVHIVSAKPLFSGAKIPVRVATLCKLKGFAGDAAENAQLIVTAVNAWSDPKALSARLAELGEP